MNEEKESEKEKFDWGFIGILLGFFIVLLGLVLEGVPPDIDGELGIDIAAYVQSISTITVEKPKSGDTFEISAEGLAPLLKPLADARNYYRPMGRSKGRSLSRATMTMRFRSCVYAVPLEIRVWDRPRGGRSWILFRYGKKCSSYAVSGDAFLHELTEKILSQR